MAIIQQWTQKLDIRKSRDGSEYELWHVVVVNDKTEEKVVYTGSDGACSKEAGEIMKRTKAAWR